MGVLGSRPMDLSRNLFELFGTGSPVGVADANRAQGSEYWQLDGTGGGVRWYKVGPLATDWSEGTTPTASDILMEMLYGPPPDMTSPNAVDQSAQTVLLSQLMAPPDQVGVGSSAVVPPANDADRLLMAEITAHPESGAAAATGAYLPLAGGTLTGGLVGTSGNFSGAFTAQSQLVFSGDLYPAVIATNQNNYATSTAAHLYLDASSNVNLTGLSGGVTGRVLLLTNYSGFTITLTEQDAASTAANRFSTGQVSGVAIIPNYTYILKYDGIAARWRPVGYHT